MSVFAVNSRAGFSLVEVSLAILVIAVGLLAVFGLFPTGLQAAKAAKNDTLMALYAEDVLNGFKACAAQTPWDQIESIDMEAAAPHKWDNAPRVTVQDAIQPSSYERNGIVYYSLRHRLTVSDISSPPNDVIKEVRLQVWNGEFGPTNDTRVFYTEIFKNGL